MNTIKETRDENKQLHSYNDEPAAIYNDGDKDWYHHGKLHRTSGPAAIYSNGDKFWYCHGKRHREDGPAIEYGNGTKCWYINGKRHREDGPAIEYSDGASLFYYMGEEIAFDEWVKKLPINEEEKTELILSL